MIPLILLHIAITAQVGQPSFECKDHGVWLYTGTKYGWVCDNDPNFDFSRIQPHCDDKGTCYRERNYNVGPAEHIIEIRTKRETDGWSGYPIACTEGDEAAWQDTPGPTGLWFRCIRIVKTLYIDGQRIGVIRETEEK